MSLTSAISTALSGLRATQAGMDVVSQNVSNAGTVGYTRRVLVSTPQVSGNQTTGVNVAGAQRVLDALVQKQLRLENAGAAYTSVKAGYHASLDGMFDAPGAAGSLPGLVTSFTSAFSALVTNPSSYTARATVVSAASDLAGSLNELSGQVQSLRQSAEDAIGSAVARANDILTQIAAVSNRMASDPTYAGSAGWQDQRDALVDQLSELVDVKVAARANGGIAIATSGGLQLFDGVSATRLSFDGKAAVGPNSAYDTDPARRSVGTITATDASGRTVDVLASGTIRSGRIAAYVELRDEVLPRAQTQLDALAAGLASALSDKAVAGIAATAGAATGFDLNLSALQAGNPVTVTTSAGGVSRTLTFVKAGSAAAAAAATASGNGVVGIDFSGGPAAVATQIGAALGSGFAVSNPGGSTLRILDDGAAGTTDVLALSGRATVTSLASGDTALPLFTDGTASFTGSYERGSQLAGFAGRIAVNPAVRANLATLVQYGPAVAAGDTARPEHLLDALTGAALVFTGRAGIGGSTAPFAGTVGDFATQIIATQAGDAIAARSLDDGQQVVLNAVQSRVSELSGVNVDTEMAQLIQLQTAYGANARVMSAAKDMLDTLMRVGL